MRKIIAGINMTIDGFCDHTAINPDAEIHDHYTNLLKNADTILYGRITYQLMEYWKPFVENPSGEKAMDDFANAIDSIFKIVFSHTLKDTDWVTSTLAENNIEETVSELRQLPGKDILVGSRSIIIQLLNLNLLDELQLMVHPVVAGNGLKLFENINNRKLFNLLKTKTFNSGAVLLYYQPTG